MSPANPRKTPTQRLRALREPACRPIDFRHALKRLGLSQRDAALVLGVSSAQRISEWATGRRRIPRYVQGHLRTLLELAPNDPWPTPQPIKWEVTLPKSLQPQMAIPDPKTFDPRKTPS